MVHCILRGQGRYPRCPHPVAGLHWSDSRCFCWCLKGRGAMCQNRNNRKRQKGRKGEGDGGREGGKKEGGRKTPGELCGATLVCFFFLILHLLLWGLLEATWGAAPTLWGPHTSHSIWGLETDFRAPQAPAPAQLTPTLRRQSEQEPPAPRGETELENRVLGKQTQRVSLGRWAPTVRSFLGKLSKSAGLSRRPRRSWGRWVEMELAGLPQGGNQNWHPGGAPGRTAATQPAGGRVT